MDSEFARRATVEAARLAAYWREIEFWLKKAEQVNQEAIIPAINELRYASRQMIVATNRLREEDLTQIDQRHIEKRLTIAEQYLFNAEHDIVDSITTYYDRFIRTLDDEVGPTSVTELFPEYPFMKEKLTECQELIADARLEYFKRGENYGKIKGDHLPFLIKSYAKLTDAEVKARHQKNQAEAELTRARARIGILEKLTIAGAVAGIVALISVPLSIYLWIVPREDFCRWYGNTWVIGRVCPAALVGKQPAAIGGKR